MSTVHVFVYGEADKLLGKGKRRLQTKEGAADTPATAKAWCKGRGYIYYDGKQVLYYEKA